MFFKLHKKNEKLRTFLWKSEKTRNQTEILSEKTTRPGRRTLPTRLFWASRTGIVVFRAIFRICSDDESFLELFEVKYRNLKKWFQSSFKSYLPKRADTGRISRLVTRLKLNIMSWKIDQNVDLSEFYTHDLLRAGWRIGNMPRAGKKGQKSHPTWPRGPLIIRQQTGRSQT